MAKDWSREIAAVTPHLRGETANIIGGQPVPIPGINQEVEATVLGMASLTEASWDTIVSIAGIGGLTDLVGGLRAIRRGLRSAGRLVLVLPDAEHCDAAYGNRYSPQSIVNILLLVGGFEVIHADEVTTNDSYIIVAERSVTAEVRAPFGIHGPNITRQVLADETMRAEYYFQIGTMMLQTGDAGMAVPCFENVLQIEPQNAEAHFGLGMTYGTQGRWDEAIQQFQTSQQITPGNAEVDRWLELARQQIQAAQNPAAGTAPQQIHIPQTAPAPAGLRTPSPSQPTDPQSVPTQVGAGAGAVGVQSPAGPPVGTQVPVSGT